MPPKRRDEVNMDQPSRSNFENVSSCKGLLPSISEVDEIEENTILTDSSHCSPHKFDKNFIEKLRSGEVTQLKSLFPRGSLDNLMKLKKNRRMSKLSNVNPSVVQSETDEGLTSVSSLKLSSPDTSFGNKGNDSSISQPTISKEVQERRRKNLKRKIELTCPADKTTYDIVGTKGSHECTSQVDSHEEVVKNKNQIEAQESINLSVTDSTVSTYSFITMRSRKFKEIMCNERKCSVQLQLDSSQDSNLKEIEMSDNIGIRTLKTPQSSRDVINQSKVLENESCVTISNLATTSNNPIMFISKQNLNESKLLEHESYGTLKKGSSLMAFPSLRKDKEQEKVEDQISSPPNVTATEVMQVEEKMKTAGNVFALPIHPVRLHNRNNSTENSASNSNSTGKLGTKNNKSFSTVNRTINELSFEDTSLNVSEIPKDKTLLQKKKLIYHSTLVDPVIALLLQKRENNEKTAPYKTGNTEISNKKNVSVQVSKTVSSSSSDAGTKLKQKASEELSTYYSSLSCGSFRRRKSSNTSAEEVPEKRRYVTFGSTPTCAFDRSSDLKSETNVSNTVNLKRQKKSVKFAPGTIYFEQSTPTKDNNINSDLFSSSMSSGNSDTLRNEQKAATSSCCKSGARKCSISDVDDISVVYSDLNKDIKESLLIEEPGSLVQNISSGYLYHIPSPHSFRSLDQTSYIKLSGPVEKVLTCLNEIENVSNLSSTSGECTLYKNAKRAVLEQRMSPLREVEEKRKCVRRKIKENILDGEIYIPPRKVRPSPWVSDKLYSFLIKKLEPRFGLEGRVKSETVVSYLCASVTTCSKLTKYKEIHNALLVLRNIFFSCDICRTYLDIYSFILHYTPHDTQSKVIPLSGLFNSCKEMSDKKPFDLIANTI